MKTLTLYTYIGLTAIMISFNSCNKVNPAKNPADKIIPADTTDQTNDFYDNAETHLLAIKQISIAGEITNPGDIDLSGLPIRSVIVKEAVLDGSGNKFVGAYRYDGYSLYDILNKIKIQKANEKEFSSIIDLYITIENEKGEKVIVSWGEIYYSNHLHEIIIASRVTRIVPSKTKDLWPLPVESKLIISSDLITERNISMPTKITVKSYKKSFPTQKGMKPLYSPKIDLFCNNIVVKSLDKLPDSLTKQVFSTIFYGRGRGIHSTQPFTGVMLKNVLEPYVEFSQKNLRTGTFLIVAKDGYRALYTFSELMNRNDQAEVLLICKPELKDDGIFKVFPACDFFSDRAVKAITGIYFSNEEN